MSNGYRAGLDQYDEGKLKIVRLILYLPHSLWRINNYTSSIDWTYVIIISQCDRVANTMYV